MATSIKGEESPAKLKRELVIFLVAIGLLLAVSAWFAYTRLQGNMYPLWDHPRHLAIGVPVAVLAGLHLVAGLLLGLSGNKLFAVLGVVAGALLAVFYFVFMVSTSGKFPVNLISGVMIATPLVLGSRVATYMRAKKS